MISLVRLALAVGTIAAVVACAAALSLPDVTDAHERVQAILHQHGGHEVPIPPKVPAAVVAVEDRRFYQHPGLDPVSLARAAWVHLASDQAAGGATITAQLVENLYVPQTAPPQ